MFSYEYYEVFKKILLKYTVAGSALEFRGKLMIKSGN